MPDLQPFQKLEQFDIQAERALDEADRMRIEASRMRQLGFKEIARFLDSNANAAMKWAANIKTSAVPTGSGVYGTDRVNGCLWTGTDGTGVGSRESYRSPALVIEFQPAANREVSL